MLGVIFEFIGAFVLYLFYQIIAKVGTTRKRTFGEIMYSEESLNTIDRYSSGLKNRTIGIVFVAFVIIIVNLFI